MNSIELLFVFLLTISFTSLFVSALLAEKSNVEKTKNTIDEIIRSRQAARTVEIWLNAGRISDIDFYDEKIRFRIEEDSFLVNYNGKVIQVEGVFEDADKEPI